MSRTLSRDNVRLLSVVSVIGIVLLAAGVGSAIIIRIASTVISASGPMPVLSQGAYTGYALGPARPFANPSALSDALVPIAFGIAALGLLILVAGTALHATRRTS